jgi:DNA-binding IscR family transcriptional regulator
MKLSCACGYAVRGLAYLAAQRPGRMVPSNEIER